MEINVPIPEGNGQPVNETPQGQAPTAPQTPVSNAAPTGQADTPAPNLEGADNWEYDGNPNTVPPQFQKFAKGMQQHFTKRSMTEAEIRRKGQEYDQFVQSDDFRAFQEWRQQRQGQPEQAQAPANPELISQAEWEAAQLDPTGRTAQALMERVAEAKAARVLNQAVQAYGGQLQQLQQQQQQVQFNTALNDFADAHPDVVDLHAMGLMKPHLDEELASRKHATYESALTAAYSRASEARERIRAALLQEQNELVQKKKGAVSQNGTVTGEQTVVHVERSDAFDTAIGNALAGKKVKNKLK